MPLCAVMQGAADKATALATHSPPAQAAAYVSRLEGIVEARARGELPCPRIDLCARLRDLPPLEPLARAPRRASVRAGRTRGSVLNSVACGMPDSSS